MRCCKDATIGFCPARPVSLVAPVAVPHIFHLARSRAPELHLSPPPGLLQLRSMRASGRAAICSHQSDIRTPYEPERLRHRHVVARWWRRLALHPTLIVLLVTNHSSISDGSPLYPLLSLWHFIVPYRGGKHGYRISQVHGGPFSDALVERELISPTFDSQGRLTHRSAFATLHPIFFFCPSYHFGYHF